MSEPDIDPRTGGDGYDDPFPCSDAHLRWQAEAEACAAARERELGEILRRVAGRTHTPQDVQRLLRELDIAPTRPRAAARARANRTEPPEHTDRRTPT